MMKLISALVLFLGVAAAARAQTPGALTSLKALHALANDQIGHGIPVAFEATVSYSRGYEKLLFVQDGDEGIFVRPPTDATFSPGDRVLVRGIAHQSFRPFVTGKSVTVVGHGALPKPVRATFAELIRGEQDARLVTVRAVVRAADLVMSPNAPIQNSHLQLVTDGGHFEAELDRQNADVLRGLLDAEVEVTGTVAGRFDDKMQETGIALLVPELSGIKVLSRAAASPWSLPLTPMDRVLGVYHVRDLTPRVHVQGIITYYQPGSVLVLQDGAKSLWIWTHTHEPLRIGDHADATGFPYAQDRVLMLNDGEIQDSQMPAPIKPLAASWSELARWSANLPDGHQGDLVSTEGRVVGEVRETSQDAYVLAAEGRLFNAFYRHPPDSNSLAPMKKAPIGSLIRVTGICSIQDTGNITPGEEAPFHILLRSFDDVAVVEGPPLLGIRNLLLLVGLLLLVVGAVGYRGWRLERKVRRQTATMAARAEAEAALERRRSRILEQINGTRPLAEILEQITELVSSKMGNAPCWCEIKDGARLGSRPHDLAGLRILQEEIRARSGAQLGVLFASFHPLAQHSADEPGSLTVGTRLAALAIETRGLYSDLLRRSEFDLLTDIRNRFSMEKSLDASIEAARQNASIFGLIYIDLDKFKQVNDIHGHLVGDMYLQEAAQRMKRQLRPGDMLARLGGDEFAASVGIRNRAEVREIAARLEHCFDEPFSLDGLVLHGSASVGVAIYPEDGATRDSLLYAADSAMYLTKNGKAQAKPGGRSLRT